MEKMVHNNVQLLGNRIPKAKRAQTILDMARAQHQKKRRLIEDDSDGEENGTADGQVDSTTDKKCTVIPAPKPTSPIQMNQINENTGTGTLTWNFPVQLRPDTLASRTINSDVQKREVPKIAMKSPSRVGYLNAPPARTPVVVGTIQSLHQLSEQASLESKKHPQSPARRVEQPQAVSTPVRQEVPKPDITSPDVVFISPPPRRIDKPEKVKALSAISSSFKSMCFSTEDPITSLDITPDGQCIIAAFSNGSVRLYDVNSTHTEERFGYLLGHLDEELNQQMGPTVVRVKVTSDGCYCFVGCRGTSPKTLMAIHLDKFRMEKDSDEDNLSKYFLNDSKIRGFADVSPNTASPGAMKSYFIITGLGVGTYRLWRFQEQPNGMDPTWSFIRNFNDQSNTSLHAYFYLGSNTTTGFAGVGCDCNLKVFRFSSTDPNDGDVFTQEIIQGTKDISYIKGSFAYGCSNAGTFYRLALPNTTHRDTFDLVIEASRRSSRSASLIEHIYATDDGLHVIALADSIVYYCATDGLAKTGNYLMHTLGHCIPGSFVPKYGIPAAIYVPQITGVNEPVVLLTTNAEEERDGYLTMDPVRKMQRALARGKPLNGLNCWVCGSHSSLHWGVKTAKQLPPPVQTKVSKLLAPKVVVERPEHQIKAPEIVHSLTDNATKFEISDLQQTVDSLEKQLETAQKRVTQVKNEADRRLRAELQLRRSWKKQQSTYEEQVAAATANVDNLTLQNAALQNQVNEIKAKLEHESMKHDQEDGVRLQYDQLCSQVREKITRVDDHQKILEQTTKSLLKVIQKNTLALKNDGAETVLEITKTECVICRDKPANVAVYPCGHLCFCQDDGEKYKNHLRHKGQCPVCQVEMISLLRIYAP